MTSPSRDDVLDAFSVEEDHGRTTLERYLKSYPQFAEEIVDLARELMRTDIDADGEISKDGEAYIDAAWLRHAAAASSSGLIGHIELSVDDQRRVAQELGVPRQVVIAFKECRVLLVSVPRKFLERFSKAIRWTTEAFIATFDNNRMHVELSQSFKSDTKPKPVEQVTFEQILIDAGVPLEKRADLLSDRE